MAVNPRAVVSPRRRLNQLRVIYQVTDWSLAIGVWDGVRALLVRWNGDTDHPLGNPVSHSHPTWFVLPKDMHSAVLALIPDPNRSSAEAWLAGRDPNVWTV